MLRRVWEAIIRHQRGVAAIEFALILPLFVLLLLGGYEAWQYIVADQRADRVSASVADLASRVDGSISEPVVNDLLDGGAFIGKPIDFTTNGVIYLSAVNGGDANLLPADRNKILWCRVLGNTTLAASSLGSVGSNANLASVTTSAGVVGDVESEWASAGQAVGSEGSRAGRA